MTFKNILVHVDFGQSGETRLRCAADLADRFDALLIGCGCQMQPPVTRGPFVSGAGQVATSLIDTSEQHLAQAQKAFEHIAPPNRRRWIASRSLPDEALAEAAKAADIVVTGRLPDRVSDPTRHEDPGTLAVISGRPVLVAPPGHDYLKADRILVCWKERREANRAVTDALPLLMRAEEVLVVEVAMADDLVAAHQRVEDVAGFLRQHGVRATGESILRDARRTAQILQDRANWFGADLIVAGGYGRSRLGEWAFGGVTKALLDQKDRFVLLSH
jgi:nucleotide-binding universal stress UspA family protein